MSTFTANFDFDSMVTALNLIHAKGTRLSVKRQKELVQAIHFLATKSYDRGFEEGQKYSSYQRCILPPPNDNKYHFDPFNTPLTPWPPPNPNYDKFPIPIQPAKPYNPIWDDGVIWCESKPCGTQI